MPSLPALDCVIHPALRDPARRQRPARIARLHRHADLKIARVIRRAGQRRDFVFSQLGREPLQTDVGKTDRRRRASKIHRTTGGNWQRRKFPVRFQQSQIIGRIHRKFTVTGQNDKTFGRRRMSGSKQLFNHSKSGLEKQNFNWCFTR
jgi:hypothetical protein